MAERELNRPEVSSPPGVTLRFTDGHTETADIVVAADGIRSAVREALFNPAPPVFAGFVAWRGAEAPT